MVATAPERLRPVPHGSNVIDNFGRHVIVPTILRLADTPVDLTAEDDVRFVVEGMRTIFTESTSARLRVARTIRTITHPSSTESKMERALRQNEHDGPIIDALQSMSASPIPPGMLVLCFYAGDAHLSKVLGNSLTIPSNLVYVNASRSVRQRNSWRDIGSPYGGAVVALHETGHGMGAQHSHCMPGSGQGCAEVMAPGYQRAPNARFDSEFPLNWNTRAESDVARSAFIMAPPEAQEALEQAYFRLAHSGHSPGRILTGAQPTNPRYRNSGETTWAIECDDAVLEYSEDIGVTVHAGRELERYRDEEARAYQPPLVR
jgi:hypothetical protein